MMNLKILINEGVIDENQKLIIYKYNDNIKKYVILQKGFAHNIKDEAILNNKNITIMEIKKEDLDYYIRNHFKCDFIGVYLD